MQFSYVSRVVCVSKLLLRNMMGSILLNKFVKARLQSYVRLGRCCCCLPVIVLIWSRVAGGLFKIRKSATEEDNEVSSASHEGRKSLGIIVIVMVEVLK